MAKQQRLYDLWLVKANSVYREVPYAVVADWLRQGRVGPDDRIRTAGKEGWTPVSEVTALTAFLPKESAVPAAGPGEAQEPVSLEFSYRRPGDDEDDDPDMIPLIDVSLVLLIFFMLTATVSAVAQINVNVPQAANAFTMEQAGGFTINALPGSDGKPRYTLTVGDRPAQEGDANLDQAGVIARVTAKLKERSEPVEVRIAADETLPGDAIIELTGELEKLRLATKGIATIKGVVSEKKS